MLLDNYRCDFVNRRKFIVLNGRAHLCLQHANHDAQRRAVRQPRTEVLAEQGREYRPWGTGLPPPTGKGNFGGSYLMRSGLQTSRGRHSQRYSLGGGSSGAGSGDQFPVYLRYRQALRGRARDGKDAAMAGADGRPSNVAGQVRRPVGVLRARSDECRQRAVQGAGTGRSRVWRPRHWHPARLYTTRCQCIDQGSRGIRQTAS